LVCVPVAKPEDVFARQVQAVHCLRGDDQRLGGVEAAGDADDDLFDAGGAQALDQAGDLDVVGLVTILLERLRVSGNEREARERSLQPQIGARRVQAEGDVAERGGGIGVEPPVVVEAAHAQAFLAEHVEVDVGDGVLRVGREARCLGEQRAVLEDRGLAVPCEVGG
jgi:hypothetical protein